MRVKLSVVSFDAKFGLRVVSKACSKSWMIEALVNFSPLIFFSPWICDINHSFLGNHTPMIYHSYQISQLSGWWVPRWCFILGFPHVIVIFPLKNDEPIEGHPVFSPWLRWQMWSHYFFKKKYIPKRWNFRQVNERSKIQLTSWLISFIGWVLVSNIFIFTLFGLRFSFWLIFLRWFQTTN